MSRNEARVVLPAPDVITAHLEDEAILLRLAQQSYFRLNQTGAHIWKGFESQMNLASITGSLVGRFDVSQEEARASINGLVAELLDRKLVIVQE